MKLNKLFESVQEVIVEGLRFGKKQESLVERESNNIRVGIEYEFHVDGEWDENNEAYDEAISETAYEIMQEELEEKKEEFIDQYAQNDFDEYQVGDITAAINNIKGLASNVIDELNEISSNEGTMEDALDNWDGEEEDNKEYGGFENEDDREHVRSFMRLAERIAGNVEEIMQEAQNLTSYDYVEETVNYLDSDIDVSDLANEAENIANFYNEADSSLSEDSITSMQGEWVSPDDLIDQLTPIMNLSGSDSDWDDDILENMKESAEDLWDSDKESFLGFDPDNGPDDRHYDRAAELVDRSDYEGDIVAVTKEKMEDEGIDTIKFEEFTTDASVDNGVEFITHPLPLLKSHALMEEMFEFIQDNGSTSSSTGMHVNMSLHGIRFDKENFNPTKLLMLMDEKYMLEKFKVRPQYAPSHMSEVGPAKLLHWAASLNGDDLLRKVENDFVQDNKFRTINFGNTFADHLDHRRRVEFRFFGGAGYEDDYEKMVYEINRAAYMLMVAFSPTFGHKEYLKKITKMIDMRVGEVFPMNFNDLIRAVRELKGDDKEIFKDTLYSAGNKDYQGAGQWVHLVYSLIHTKPFNKYAEKFLEMPYGRMLASDITQRYPEAESLDQALEIIRKGVGKTGKHARPIGTLPR